MVVTPRDIIDFWEKIVGEERWYVDQPALDEIIRRDYRPLWNDACAGELASWENTPEGALALLIILDQFPRNMFRDHASAFASDAKARDVADRAIARGFDLKVEPPIRQFFYTPFEHSENPADQGRSVKLFGERLGLDHYTHPYVLKHRDQIMRFGRFPSRNKALGRISTTEEEIFLAGNA